MKLLMTDRKKMSLIKVMAIIVAGMTCAGGMGCSRPAAEKPATVQGEVTLDGKPVVAGLISFFPTQELGGPSGGAEIKDGKFSIETKTGLVAGDYRVEVTVIPRNSAGQKPETSAETVRPVNETPGSQSAEEVIREFKNPAQTATLTTGANSYQLELRSAP